MNRDEANDLMLLESFKSYEARKKEGILYSKDDFIPAALITIYCQSPSRINFDEIYYNFKRRYIYNENEMENIHSKEERAGLGVVYDYIQSNDWKKLDSIYMILVIHQKLYSKTPNPTYGGKFRKTSAFISNSDVDTTIPEEIPNEVMYLEEKFKRLTDFANSIDVNDDNDIVDYITECVRLKARLVEIHPFADGNGRTCRALLNILFKKANLPPVYVRNSEKDEYIKAMDDAIRLKNTKAIERFYYYKICDSIVELDIKDRIEKIEKSNKIRVRKSV